MVMTSGSSLGVSAAACVFGVVAVDAGQTYRLFLDTQVSLAPTQCLQDFVLNYVAIGETRTFR